MQYQLETRQHPTTEEETDAWTPTRMLWEQRDRSGRLVWEVLRDSIRLVAGEVSVTRVDFFVRYGSPGEPAEVRINEVEHGFNSGLLPRWFTPPPPYWLLPYMATLLPRWFNLQLTELAAKAWLIMAADEGQRSRFAAQAMARQHGGP